MKTQLINRYSCVLLVVVLASTYFTVISIASEIDGQAVLTRTIEQDDGFGNTVVELKMTLSNAHGQSSSRYLNISTLEVDGDGDKLLTIFDRPRDIKGTALLAYTHVDKDDDQWLYLPAARRVKRISSSNKSGSFMGSEIAYEDLASEEINKYTDYNLIREEECGTQMCHVVERRPIDPESGYTRQLVWIDQDHYRFVRIDYYDRRNALLKTRTFSEYEQYLGKYWRSREIRVENHQSGKVTELSVRNIEFQVGLTEGDFDRAALRRAR